MKEENKVLRKVVEQTMKEYNDLQLKLAHHVHQANQLAKAKWSLFVCLFKKQAIISCAFD